MSTLDSSFIAADYAAWLSEIKPRTCLLVKWLAELGAVPDPNPHVRARATRFAEKRWLLGAMVDKRGGETVNKTLTLIEQGDFDIYVAWLMWLRFVEYVPARYVLPEGRERVLAWVRDQLHRQELTDKETVEELHWQANRIRESWGDNNDPPWLR